mgnify:CR=1 FL=1
MRRYLALLTLCGTLLAHVPAWAVKPGEQLPDPDQEARARRLSAELRCLVCQNQSIDDSDASLASDLRRIVRERISAGDKDEAIRIYLVDRYGEFVLLKPSFSTQTLILWGLPVVALLLGGLAASKLFRARTNAAEAGDSDSEPAPSPLSEAEQQELARLMKKKSGA